MATRREVMLGSAAALAGCAVGAPRPLPADAVAATPRLLDAPPVNLPRAFEWMEREGLDALVVSDPVNVYHLSGFWPATARMGYDAPVVAVLARDPARPLAVVTGEFTWYYLLSDNGFRYPLETFLYGAPPDPGRQAAAWQEGTILQAESRVFPDAGIAPMSARERRRAEDARASIARHPLEAGRDAALVRALRWAGLDRGRIAVDGDAVRATVERAGLSTLCASADTVLKRIRMVKSPTEVALLRAAATANVEAAVSAARAVREGATLREFRRRFYVEAARGGNRGVFMVVDGVSAEGVDEELREGQAFMFDAVSEGAGYHGDFARTVFVGEPAAAMRRITVAVHRSWEAVRAALRPGLRFSEITRIGREAMRASGQDLAVMFGPHSVGLFHNDAVGLGDLALEPGMVVSVDCPLLESGAGGTVHLEDLMLVTAAGAEPLHPVPPPVLEV